MEILDVLIDPIVPVFAIMAIGFAMGRFGSIRVEEARTINKFAMTVLLPLLVFDLIANADIASFQLIPLAIYGGSQFLVFLIGYYLASRIFGCEQREALLLAFGGIFANNVLYVVPMAILLYGEGDILPLTAIITWDSTVVFAAVLIALQIIDLGKVTASKVVLSLIRTPMLIGMALGLVVSFAQVSIPGPVQTFLSFNGSAAAPVALFALGVVMSETRLRPEASAIAFSVVKIFVLPLVVWLGFLMFAPSSGERGLYLLGSAGPAGAMAFSLALLHGVRTQAISQLIVITSILTLGSLAFLA